MRAENLRAPLLPRAAILLLLAQPLACPSRPAPTAASAEPVKAASAPPPIASASAPRAAISHQPGTVPAPHKPPAAAADAGAAAPPALTKLAAAKSRKGTVQAYQVSFDGKRATLVISGSAGLEVLDPATGAGAAIRQASPESFAVAADASLVAVAGSGSITLWDAAKGALLHTWPGSASSLAFSADAKKLAVGGESGIFVRDTATGKELVHAKPDFNTFGVAFSANGKELVATGNNTQVAVFAIDSGAALPGGGSAETTGTFGIAISPDGRFAAASAPAGHGLQVFDVHAWAPRTLVVVPEGACKEHVGPWFSPNGRFVFANGGARWVKGFEAGSWKPYASYHAPPGREIASVAADLSRAVVTRDEGRGAVVVTVASGAETKLERAFAESASYTVSDDGLRVAGTAGNAVRVWSAKTGKVEYEEQP